MKKRFVVAAVALASFALPACGGDDDGGGTDPAAVETFIESKLGLAQQGYTASCPEAIPEDGTTITCTVTDKNGNEYDVPTKDTGEWVNVDTAQVPISTGQLKSCLRDAKLDISATGTRSINEIGPFPTISVRVGTQILDQVTFWILGSPEEADTVAAQAVGTGTRTTHGNVVKVVVPGGKVPPNKDAAINSCLPSR